MDPEVWRSFPADLLPAVAAALLHVTTPLGATTAQQAAVRSSVALIGRGFAAGVAASPWQELTLTRRSGAHTEAQWKACSQRHLASLRLLGPHSFLQSEGVRTQAGIRAAAASGASGLHGITLTEAPPALLCSAFGDQLTALSLQHTDFKYSGGSAEAAWAVWQQFPPLMRRLAEGDGLWQDLRGPLPSLAGLAALRHLRLLELHNVGIEQLGGLHPAPPALRALKLHLPDLALLDDLPPTCAGLELLDLSKVRSSSSDDGASVRFSLARLLPRAQRITLRCDEAFALSRGTGGWELAESVVQAVVAAGEAAGFRRLHVTGQLRVVDSTWAAGKPGYALHQLGRHRLHQSELCAAVEQEAADHLSAELRGRGVVLALRDAAAPSAYAFAAALGPRNLALLQTRALVSSLKLSPQPSPCAAAVLGHPAFVERNAPTLAALDCPLTPALQLACFPSLSALAGPWLAAPASAPLQALTSLTVTSAAAATAAPFDATWLASAGLLRELALHERAADGRRSLLPADLSAIPSLDRLTVRVEGGPHAPPLLLDDSALVVAPGFRCGQLVVQAEGRAVEVWLGSAAAAHAGAVEVAFGSPEGRPSAGGGCLSFAGDGAADCLAQLAALPALCSLRVAVHGCTPAMRVLLGRGGRGAQTTLAALAQCVASSRWAPCFRVEHEVCSLAGGSAAAAKAAQAAQATHRASLLLARIPGAEPLPERLPEPPTRQPLQPAGNTAQAGAAVPVGMGSGVKPRAARREAQGPAPLSNPRWRR